MTINKASRLLLKIITTTFLLNLLGGFSASLVAAQPRIVAALGSAKVNGKPALVEVLVQVKPGKSVKEAVTNALSNQGARPFQSAELGSLPGFNVTGLFWESKTVTQNYNPADEPIPGQAALLASHATWNDVVDSDFSFEFEGNTDNCPSLVRECPGRQTEDGQNDVAWLSLGGCCTIGVTWFISGEADMALNTGFSWADDGVNDIDIETVLLHENGHVLGLDHSDLNGAVMEATYAGPRRALDDDDKYGIVYLYDEMIMGSLEGIVLDDSGSPVTGATVVLEDTGLEGTTDDSGTYLITDVPDPVGYTLSASAPDHGSSTQFQIVDASTSVDFTLTNSGDSGGMCILGLVGDACSDDAECCSNKCKGPPTNKFCKPNGRSSQLFR